VKQSATAALIYAADHDDSLPSALEWMDAVLPYTKTSALQCPMVRDGHGYAMNDAVSRKKTPKIVDPNKVVMLFETEDLAYNAHGKPPSLTTPGPRHGSRSVAFADGSAKGIKNAGR
jgi:prepilin-type processing-associated H-X9-DG protein